MASVNEDKILEFEEKPDDIDFTYLDGETMEMNGHKLRFIAGIFLGITRFRVYCVSCGNEYIKDFDTEFDEALPYLQSYMLDEYTHRCSR